MKFILPIQRAYDLQHLLNSVDRANRAVPNVGVKTFEKRWSQWTDEQKRDFLYDVRQILKPYHELRRAKVIVEAEIEDQQ